VERYRRVRQAHQPEHSDTFAADPAGRQEGEFTLLETDVGDFRLPAIDGFELAATLYRPAGAVATMPVVLVNSATGVKRGYYDKYARYLVERGFMVVTFDYRGIGGSRPRSLRGFPARISDWADRDSAGAIEWIVENLRPRHLLLVGHSIGGQLFGLTPNNSRVDAMLAVSAQSGYWGAWSGPRRYFMWFLWHALMPGASRIFSYYPSKKLGTGEDLPARVARDWARWGRNPNYIVDETGAPIRENFISFTGPMRFYSFEDDIHAPRQAVEALFNFYLRAAKEWRHQTPEELGARAVGHFGFFREQFRATLWAESADWLSGQCSADQREPKKLE
jgi:predicted alpha/beta hydrolase